MKPNLVLNEDEKKVRLNNSSNIGKFLASKPWLGKLVKHEQKPWSTCTNKEAVILSISSFMIRTRAWSLDKSSKTTHHCMYKALHCYDFLMPALYQGVAVSTQGCMHHQ